jgi:RNA-splicing ligase RtcB
MEGLELTGGRTSAVVYGNYPDPEELRQIYAMMDCPAFAGASIRIMPDHHAGKGCVIGFTCPVPVGGAVVPNIVGVDIGCGVQALNLGTRKMGENEFKAFDRHLRETVPSGFNGRAETFKDLQQTYTRYVDERFPWVNFQRQVADLAKKIGTKDQQVWCSAGTLGGGNHFIELDRDQASDDLYLTVHSGSRNFGLKVCLYHQKKATDKVGPKGGLEWLEGDDAEEYLRDMRTAQQFAMLNRMVMLTVLAKHFDVKMRDAELVTSVHNFIGEDRIIRKGAISAKAGEQVIIPWNMADGVIIGIGKGHLDWNQSAPHGAGRIMSRGEAKRTLTLTDYKAAMEGIWSSCIGRDTIDEAPATYKKSQEVEDAIGATVEVTQRLKPIYNFKASKDE